MTTGTRRNRIERIEVQATPEDRALIYRAIKAEETDLTSFVTANLTAAARRVPADRTDFVLSGASLAEWEAINDRPPRDLEGLRAPTARPPPIVDE